MRWQSLPALCLLATLGGCVPYLSSSETSPHLRGRVLDAATGTPVEKARVVITSPGPSVVYGPGPLKRKPRLSTAVYTDKGGLFDLPAHDQLHLWMVVGICGGEGPEWREPSNYFRISHPGYVEQDHDAPSLASRPRQAGDPWTVGDIKLKPRPPQSRE